MRKSKARRVIEKWLKQEKADRQPVYIAEGFVFMYPAKSTDGVYHYPVVWVTRKTPSKVIHEFICGCRGWFHSETDECYHVKDLKHQIETDMEKAVSG